MPDTYDMSDKGVLSCFECGMDTSVGLDVELRHCSHCGYWHVSRLKPGWAKDELEMDVVETALELGHQLEGGKYGPNLQQIKKAEADHADAISALVAEHEGKWERT